MPALPIACSLTPDALQARRDGLLRALASRASRREDLADGLALEFVASGETLALVTSAIDAERQCCRFLRFRLTVEPDGGPLRLELTGPAGSREFITALLED